MSQALSQLPISPRTALVKIDFVSANLGMDPERVVKMADGATLEDGGLQWVFNLATNPNGKIRNLRFWVNELVDSQAVSRLALEEVVNRMLPVTRNNFQSGEICRMFQIRRPSLKLLRRDMGGSIRNRAASFPRNSLAAFLKRRWLGAGV